MLMLFLHFSCRASGALPKNKNMILEGPKQVAKTKDAKTRRRMKSCFPLRGQRHCISPFTSPSLAESEVGALFAGGLGRIGGGGDWFRGGEGAVVWWGGLTCALNPPKK